MNLINWRRKTVSSYHALPNIFERMMDDKFFYDYDNNNFVGIPFEDDGSSGTMNVHP